MALKEDTNVSEVLQQSPKCQSVKWHQGPKDLKIKKKLIVHHSCNVTLFSSQLTNRHNKLECFITLGWKSLFGANTLAYWTYS
jgi:hypothetical protein